MNNQFLHEIAKHLTTRDGQTFEIPVGGSLSLLALGDVGLTAWREAKLKYRQEQLSLHNLSSKQTNIDDQ